MHAPANAGDEALRVGAALRPSFSLGEADVLAFVAIPLVLGALVVGAVAWAAHRLREGERVASRAIGATGLLAGGWLAASWYAARSGALAPLDARERTLAVAALAAAALVLALLGFGRRLAAGLPLTALIGVQAFRWPLAHALDGLAARGVAPGAAGLVYGLEAAVGISALAAAAVAHRARARVLLALWNLAALAVLAATTAVTLGAGRSIRFAGGAHGGMWLAHAPFVWLPAAMLPVAFAGHLLVFRALGAAAPAARAARVPAPGPKALVPGPRADRSAA
ncbi:MAG TPA: hypothetical protein VK081_05625 [Planctomycetota bacterium]|nr:hypothetical protein [Planctomycetota bacterium]